MKGWGTFVVSVMIIGGLMVVVVLRLTTPEWVPEVVRQQTTGWTLCGFHEIMFIDPTPPIDYFHPIMVKRAIPYWSRRAWGLFPQYAIHDLLQEEAFVTPLRLRDGTTVKDTRSLIHDDYLIPCPGMTS